MGGQVDDRDYDRQMADDPRRGSNGRTMALKDPDSGWSSNNQEPTYYNLKDGDAPRQKRGRTKTMHNLRDRSDRNELEPTNRKPSKPKLNTIRTYCNPRDGDEYRDGYDQRDRPKVRRTKTMHNVEDGRRKPDKKRSKTVREDGDTRHKYSKSQHYKRKS